MGFSTSRLMAIQSIIVALILWASLVTSASDWPQYRGPLGAGVSTERVVTPPAELWRMTPGAGMSSMIASNGRVYAIGHVRGVAGRGDNTLYCLDSDTGAVIWTFSYNCRSVQGGFGSTPLDPTGPRATPATDGVNVYTISLEGHLFCNDAETGEVVWYRSVPGRLGKSGGPYGFCSSPMLHGGTLLLDIGGLLVGLDKTSGSELWRRDGGGTSSSMSVTPTFGASPLVVFGSMNIIGVDVTDGSQIWQHAMGYEAMGCHIVSGNKVVFSSSPSNGKIARLSLSGPSVSTDWERADIQTYFPSNVLIDTHLYVMDNYGTYWYPHDSGTPEPGYPNTSSFKCLDFETGGTQWSKTGMGWANVIAADNELVVLSETGAIFRVAANPASYSEIGYYPNVIDSYCWATPILSDGRLYCRNDKGVLVCLSVAPAVSIVSSDPLAREPSDNGAFIVSRVAADLSSSLTVTFLIDGTAGSGDYTLTGASLSATTLTIPAGESSATVTLTPLSVSATGTVTLSLSDSSVYTVSSHRQSATIYILDSAATVSTVTILADNGWALESGLDDDAFVIQRDSANAWPLVVNVSISGSAPLTDYTLRGMDGSTTVIIPASATETRIRIKAISNAVVDGDRTVVASIALNAAYYTIGTASTATMTIVDDDGASVDSDADGLDDGWEFCYWDNLSRNGTGDVDTDGLTDAREYQYRTNPLVADTDRDGSDDGEEVDAEKNPLNPFSFSDSVAPVKTERPGRWCAVGGRTASTPFAAPVVALLMVSVVVLRKQTASASRFNAAIFLLIMIMGLSGMNCAFVTQIIDRTISETPEMKADRILFDRDLPDITSSIAGGEAGTGGGAVGGCWNCGCRRPGLPVYEPETTCCVKKGVECFQHIAPEAEDGCGTTCSQKSACDTTIEPKSNCGSTCEPNTSCGTKSAPLFADNASIVSQYVNKPFGGFAAGSMSQTAVETINDDLWTPDSDDSDLWTPDEQDDELWSPELSETKETFVDKGVKNEQQPDKNQYELVLETRAVKAFRKPAELDDDFTGTVYPTLGQFPNQLYYFAFYAGITSQMSWMAEAEQSVYDDSNSGWGKLNFTKLLDSDWRMDFEAAGLWSSVGGGGGYRTAFTYGGPAGLNWDFSVRLQASRVGNNWGGQIETEARPLLTPTTQSWIKGYYYFDENDARKFQLGFGVSQHLGYGTAVHLSFFFADAEGEIDVDYDIDPDAQPFQEAQSGSAKIEIRHRLFPNTLYSSRWLLRCAYQRYNDSWGQQANSALAMADYMFKSGTVSVGYRHYASNADYEAGSFVVSCYYKW